ncbi:MAG: dihydrodipicolinate synthase family protein [Acidobacteriota bacterium]
MKIQGIFPAIATPFDNRGDLYKIKVQHNVQKWNLASIDGYVVCGSTGETPLLSAEEKLQLFEWVAQHAAAEKMRIAGTGCESVRETVRLTNQVAAMGYQAALVLTPHFFRSQMVKPESQLVYYRTVADQSKIPVLLYNFPQVCGLELTPELVAILAQHPNIIGMKDSSGNLEGTKKFLAAAKETDPAFQVLTGSSNHLAASLAAGCTGAVLALANAVPYACVSIWEAHRQRETEAAQDWQQRISRAATLIASTYGIPGLKHAMDLMGYYGGAPRLPLIPVTPSAQAEIAVAFEGLKG